MADDQLLSLRWDLGPRTDFSNVAGVVKNLNAAVLFSIDAQLALNHQVAVARVMQNRSDFAVTFPSLRLLEIPFPGYSEQEYREALNGLEYPRVKLLEATYSNPLSFTLNINFDFLPRILEIIRDWGAAKREAAARANLAEDKALRSRALTTALVQRIAEMSTPEIQTLLRDAPIDDFLDLAESPLELETVSR